MELLDALHHDAKVKLAGSANEIDRLKERNEMVEKAFEKTNTQLHKQKEENELKLEEEARRIVEKT